VREVVATKVLGDRYHSIENSVRSPTDTRSLSLGRLPGDIVIERKNFSFYFSIVTPLMVKFSALVHPPAA
jgi:hypothetical protein